MVVLVLRAITKKGCSVTLAKLTKKQIDILRTKENFYCPECKQSVIVRAGPKVIPHFAHRKGSNCSIQGGEGAYHQKGKLLLYDWFINQGIPAELEIFISEINQRPDLLIRTKRRKIAIEYQCATIPISHIQKRNKGYKRVNILPIWILGGNQFHRTSNNHLKVNAFTSAFIQPFSSSLPTKLFYFCPQRKIISITNDLIMTSTNRALVKFMFKPLSQITFYELFSKSYFSTVQLCKLWRNEKRKLRLSTSRVYGKELAWRSWLYEKNLTPQHLPSIIHLPIRSQYQMAVPTWNWQSRFIIDFLHPLKVGDTFSLQQAQQFIRRFQYKRETEDPIIEYLAQLIHVNIIHPVSVHRYVKNTPIIFYRHIEEALRGDDELLKSFMYNETGVGE